MGFNKLFTFARKKNLYSLGKKRTAVFFAYNFLIGAPHRHSTCQIDQVIWILFQNFSCPFSRFKHLNQFIHLSANQCNSRFLLIQFWSIKALNDTKSRDSFSRKLLRIISQISAHKFTTAGSIISDINLSKFYCINRHKCCFTPKKWPSFTCSISDSSKKLEKA